jgi:hypothetical protein
MSEETGHFEHAMLLDSVLLAYERRAAGRLMHPPVDARVLAEVAALMDFRRTPIAPSLAAYGRVCAVAQLIDGLNPAQRERLASALQSDRRAVPWRPMRGTQCQAFELAAEVDELLLAGGAGSGKTDVALIGIPLWQARAARIVRKTSLEFTPMYKRLGEILGTTDGRNLSTQSWELGVPFGHQGKGVSIEFNSLAEPDSMLRLQGRPVDCLIVDDAGSGQIAQEDIQFVSRWLRSTELVRKRLIYTSNPPTSAASLWLRDDVFAPWLSPSYAGTPAASGEIRYFLPADDGPAREVPAGTPGATSRAAVLSTVHDNPRLVRSGYVDHLQRSPTAVLRRRLLENDWSAGWDLDDAMQVIPSAWVDAAMERWTPNAPCAMSAVGVDVARGGRDRTTISRRHADWFAAPLIYPGSATPDGQAVAALVLAARGPASITFIDSTGVGASPYDILKERIVIVPIVFGAAHDALDVTQSFRFFNVRSALWWRMREALDPNGRRRIALPPDRTLKAELTMPRYELRSGRLFVEDRDSIMKRLKRSPDVATAYVLALIDGDSTLAMHNDFLLTLQKSNAAWRRRNHHNPMEV